MLVLFSIFCLLLWTISLIIYYLMEKFKLTKYYGTVKTVEFFKTAKQYKTFLVIKRKFENKEQREQPGKVIGSFSAILPETQLRKHLNFKLGVIIKKDGTNVNIFYLDGTMTRLLIGALQDWFPDNNVEVGIDINDILDKPSGDKREYVLFDISHYSMPYYKKKVSPDDFLLIYCQNAKFSLKVGETILDNVEAYIKITSDLLNRPITTIENYREIIESRLYAYQLDGCHKKHEEILQWIGTDTFCSNSYTCIR